MPTYLDYAVQHNHVDHRPLAPFSQTFGQPGRRYHLVSALGIMRGLHTPPKFSSMCRTKNTLGKLKNEINTLGKLKDTFKRGIGETAVAKTAVAKTAVVYASNFAQAQG
jgi:hypothetical protein